MAGENRSKRADEHMTGKSTAEEGPKPRTTVASVEHVGDTDGCRSNAFERALATDRRGHLTLLEGSKQKPRKLKLVQR
ncbi:hypothetical protein GOBAR_DD32997 [Gossypium barbadense]|nr:hypothetical protein GOBAR_DD32997 [Gossypium barbadense]